MEFAMRFKQHYRKPRGEEEGEGNVDQDANDEVPVRQSWTIIKLIENSEITARNVTAAIQVPHFVAAVDPESFYYSLLLQYMSYSSEDELLRGFDSAKEAFKARENDLKQNCTMMDEFRQRDRQLENAFNQIHAYEILDANPADLLQEQEEFVEPIDNRMDDEQFNQALRAMNIGLQETLNLITRSISEQMGGINNRLQLFITGQAGTRLTDVTVNQSSRSVLYQESQRD